MKRPYRYLIDPMETREALASLASEDVIGLDTETYWDSATKENNLSLLQVAGRTGEILVIDALSAAILEARALVENIQVLKVAHNAKFDEGSLKSVGFAPEGLLDTLRLARKAVPLKSFSLASVAGHLFGLELDKTYQRSDWRTRPVSREQLSYAALDAQVVLEVYDGLAERLVSAGRWERERDRARLDFKGKREPRKRREKKSLIDRPWTAEERKLLDQLLRWRAEAALLAGLPGHLICSEQTLEHLVLIRPHTAEALTTIFGLGPKRIARFGLELLAQLDSFR